MRIFARFLAAVLAPALALSTPACMTAPETAPPATLASTQSSASQQLTARVAVTFDDSAITGVIVEGLANRDTGRVVEANDPVRIASISKLVMAFAALRLADEYKLDLDEDVSNYLGYVVRNPAYPDAPITVRQLLSHRSSLADRAGYVISLGESLKAKLAAPEAWSADAPPGEAAFEYANLGSAVVATVLEGASGERYDRLVERTVFAPLGITACLNWIGCDDDTLTRAVTLYRSTGEVARDDAADLPPNCTIPVADGVPCDLETYQPGTNASIFSPQGGVRIGMVDLAKLGQAIIVEDERLLSESGWSTMKASVRASLRAMNTGPHDFFCIYGLGVQVIDHPDSPCQDKLFGDGNARVGHAGEAYGLRSGLWVDPDRDRGVAYFVTAVPDRTAPDEGGFAPEEAELVRAAIER